MAKAQTGKWAMLLGLAVAVIAAFVAFAPWDGVLLLVLGLVVGAMNVSDKDATAFLVAALGLSLGAGAIGAVSILGAQVAAWVTAIVANVVALAGAAAIVVAAKAAYALAKE
jgi:hypothetical protein